MVKWWTAEFCGGRTRLEVEPPLGSPSLAVREENCHVVENNVLQNRHINMQQIADTVSISTSSVNMILQYTCKWQKSVCDGSLKCLTRKWRFVDEKHQMKIWNSYTVKLEFVYLAHSNRRWDLVIHYYDPETKQQTMQWKHASSPNPLKFKMQASAGKIMCTVFWCAGI